MALAVAGRWTTYPLVELVSLRALGDREPARELVIRGARSIVLAPHERRAVSVAFTGQPLNLGGGLSYYRYALTVAVDGHRSTAVASSAYVCRIPLRHVATP